MDETKMKLLSYKGRQIRLPSCLRSIVESKRFVDVIRSPLMGKLDRNLKSLLDHMFLGSRFKLIIFRVISDTFMRSVTVSRAESFNRDFRITEIANCRLHTFSKSDKDGKNRNNSKAMVYFHGGGFTFLTPPPFYEIANKIFSQSDCSVLILPEYRCSPEVQFPEILRDCSESIEHVYSIYGSDIVLVGDSAGGCLAVNMAIKYRKIISSVVLLSPFLDATLRGLSWDTNNSTDRILTIQRVMYVSWLTLIGNFNFVIEDNDFKNKLESYIMVPVFNIIEDVVEQSGDVNKNKNKIEGNIQIVTNDKKCTLSSSGRRVVNSNFEEPLTLTLNRHISTEIIENKENMCKLSISPLISCKEEFSDFPSTFIVASDSEVLYSDAVTLYNFLTGASVNEPEIDLTDFSSPHVFENNNHSLAICHGMRHCWMICDDSQVTRDILSHIKQFLEKGPRVDREISAAELLV